MYTMLHKKMMYEVYNSMNLLQLTLTWPLKNTL